MPPLPRLRLRRFAALLVLLADLCACAPAVPGAASSAPPPRYPTAAGPPAGVGTDTVQVLARGAVAFPVIRRLIDGARQRVDAEVYELGRADLLDALVAARRRGVEVTLITDPSVPASAAAAAHLEGTGVAVALYPVRRQMIDHVKLVVVDGGDAAVVGGINWGTGSERNHDFDALVRGPAATNLERVFLRDLATTGRAVTVPGAAVDPAVVVATTLPDTGIHPLALELVDGARGTLDLELFVLTDTGVVHGLMRARARGVRIRLLLDPGQRPSDGSAALLREAGVEVRLYRGSGEKLHAKAAVADGHRILFGSANWTAGGFVRNHELDIAFDSAAAAATLLAAMDADWARSAA
ncbi:MAG TPA: phosphatidylserine/phosphatidylglycerophosphate/cardiolipin synthase family protein [Candidatus Dormibacteraeota bacterium]|nr:phosphatidylserine/phosphatidylglycerophosphate/cardiolipin synthase family protein [Candidatus Dormibacteraeota bacterium]